jgi:hypothetical protein
MLSGGQFLRDFCKGYTVLVAIGASAMETSSASGLELESQTKEQLHRELIEAQEHYRSTGLHLTHEEVEAWLAKRESGENACLPECHL